jgi:putative transposase
LGEKKICHFPLRCGELWSSRRTGEFPSNANVNCSDAHRTGLYYQKRAKKEEDAALMKLIDAQYTLTPFYGYRRMTVYLSEQGFLVNHKRVLRLMKKLGLEAIYPKPNLSKPGKEHLKFPGFASGN